MPTNRTKRQRGRESTTLDESAARFLLSGEAERGTAGWDLKILRHFDQGEQIKKVWAEHRAEILPDWLKKNPGCLPWAEEYFQKERGGIIEKT